MAVSFKSSWGRIDIQQKSLRLYAQYVGKKKKKPALRWLPTNAKHIHLDGRPPSVVEGALPARAGYGMGFERPGAALYAWYKLTAIAEVRRNSPSSRRDNEFLIIVEGARPSPSSLRATLMGRGTASSMGLDLPGWIHVRKVTTGAGLSPGVPRPRWSQLTATTARSSPTVIQVAGCDRKSLR